MVAHAGFALTFVAFSAPCWLALALQLTAESQHYDRNSVWGWLMHHERVWGSGSVHLAFAVAGVSLALALRARDLTRRASTSLSPPIDPLATYREALAECPRHPFAR